MSIIIAWNAGRTPSANRPSSSAPATSGQKPCAKPSASIRAAAPNWAVTSVGRRPQRSASTPPVIVPTAPPTPYAPSTRPAWL